jgi:cyanamide hydratase
MTWRLVSSVEFLSFSKDPSLTMCVTEANYGFTAVPSSATALLATDPPKIPAPFTPVSQSPIPSTPLAQRIDVYAKAHLPEPTYNHCLRVYHYGLAIRQYRFPEWTFSDETYFLACLLHDIGTTKENMIATKMSFEFYGGFIALDVLQNLGASATASSAAAAPRDQAESVAEAIIRHQDFHEKGNITALGQLLQLATMFGMSRHQ